MSEARSLLPPEHGAYAELAFPLVTGLALAPPRPASLALGLAAFAFFLAHEPLVILFGLRGDRVKAQEGKRAWRRIRWFLGFGAILGGVGILRAGSIIWPSILFPVAPLLLLSPFVFLGRQKTLAAELLVVTVFAALVFPIGAASMAAPERMIWAASVWFASFALGTVEVHAIKARHRDTQRSRWTRWASPLLSGTSLLACLWLLTDGESPYWWPALALLAPALATLALAFIQVHPRRLKRVGWTLVGANAMALVTLLVSG